MTRFRSLIATTVAIASAVVVAVVPAVAGPEAIDPVPQREWTAATISVDAALQRTLALATPVALARSEAARAQGSALATSGAFDWGTNLRLAYDVGRGELLPNQLLAEVNRREAQRILRDEIGALAAELRRVLEADGRSLPACPSAIVFVNGRAVCVSDIDFANGQTLQDFLALLIAQEDDPDQRQALEDLERTQADLLRRLLANAVIVLENVSESGRQSVINLGVLPEIAKRYGFLLDLQLVKTFRNGLDLQFGAIFESVEDNFEGKPLSPTFGGRGIPTTFTAFLGFQVRAPLGQGGGRATVGAPERAAELTFRAASLQAVQAANAAARDTALAYWNLGAAQQRVALFEAAVDRETTLLDLVDGLIESDELPAMDRARARARLASSRGSLAQARQAQLGARLALAERIGLVVTREAEAPLAADALPTPPSTMPEAAANGLAQFALAARRDLLALQRAEAAATELEAAAQRDLRRRFDLTFALGYSGLHESFDQRVYDLDGLIDALNGSLTGPSGRFMLTWDVPFKNRRSRGARRQAAALRRQSQIQRADLARTVGARVHELWRSLRHAAAEVNRRQDTIRFETASLDSETERLRMGESSMIEVVFTAERLTFAELDAVDAQAAYAAVLTEVQAAMGALVRHDARDDAYTLTVEDPYDLDRLLIEAQSSPDPIGR